MQKKEEKNNLNFWHSNDLEYSYAKTLSSEQGLTSEESQRRLKSYGKNMLPQNKRTPIFKLILQNLIEPIILLLVVACAVSFFMGELIDGFAIIIIILLDLVIGVAQEAKAERIASSLSKMIKMQVKTLRDGEKYLIDSTELVVGDIIFLESGDKVPADLRIISCSNLTIDEAILTGESVNSEKNIEILKDDALLGDRKNMLFAGCSVITGRAKCLVVETGLNTQIGQIANNLTSVKDEKSPLDIRISKFSKQISIGVGIVSIIIFISLYLAGNPIDEIFLTVVALAVSAIPEGLPLAVTLALTFASNRMGKKGVVVKKLKAVESLGSCTVIATDKTGTLTLNEQTAKLVVLPNGEEFEITGSGYNNIGEIIIGENKFFEQAKEIAYLGSINNEARLTLKNEKFSSFGDSIDIAFLALAQKLKISTSTNISHRIPYESENKYSAVFYYDKERSYCTAKGSLEKILSFCNKMLKNGKEIQLNKSSLIEQHELLAQKGYRCIALAKAQLDKALPYSENDLKDMTFMGFVCFIDPIRQETKQAIADCKKAGIKVIMITGDHPSTAYAIGKEICIASNKSQLATASEVQAKFAEGEIAFDEYIKTKTIFSRVTPSDKFNIVESLKRQGEFVAVTGDGVNDTPAIKSAHIGIAMGSGTDAAKETADMIITDDNFNSIVEGVKEGRNAYSNIRKVTFFLLSCAFAEIIFFLTAIICGLPAPLIAIQLLWLNLITDGLQDMAISFEKAEKGIMEEKPRPTNESLFSKTLLLETLYSGLIMGATVFFVWLFLPTDNANLIASRSIVMALMVFMQNFHALSCRSETKSIFQIPAFSNPFFIVSILGAIILQIIIMEVNVLSNFLSLSSVPYIELLEVLLYSTSIILFMEIYKLIKRKRKQKKEKLAKLNNN